MYLKKFYLYFLFIFIFFFFVSSAYTMENSENIREFSSRRLYYRCPDDSMKAAILQLASKPAISKPLFSSSDNNKVQEIMQRLFYSNGMKRPNSMIWGAYDKETNGLKGILIGEYIDERYVETVAPVGETRSFFINDMQKNKYLNVAYAIDLPHQNQGLSKEMTMALKEIVFQHTNMNVLLHLSAPGNIYSGRSAISCGFREEGVTRYGNIFKILRKLPVVPPVNPVTLPANPKVKRTKPTFAKEPNSTKVVQPTARLPNRRIGRERVAVTQSTARLPNRRIVRERIAVTQSTARLPNRRIVRERIVVKQPTARLPNRRIVRERVVVKQPTTRLPNRRIVSTKTIGTKITTRRTRKNAGKS